MRLSVLTTPLRALFLCTCLMAQEPGDPAQVEARMEAAAQRVQEIVNQPVAKLPMGPGDHAALFRPGWFHEGALTPDFDHVDIRASQECGTYARWPFVTSDVTPGFMFAGSELEFNPMTKYFYTDRTLPKKKLTDQEMAEINELYRTIGGCLRQLREWRAQPRKAGDPPPAPGSPGIMAPLAAPQAQGEPQTPEGSILRNPWYRVLLGACGAILVLILVLRTRD